MKLFCILQDIPSVAEAIREFSKLTNTMYSLLLARIVFRAR